jgi:hypothetical protein
MPRQLSRLHSGFVPSHLWLLQVLRHIYSGAVDEAEHQLRIDSQHEHDCDCGQQSEPLSDRQIL